MQTNAKPKLEKKKTQLKPEFGPVRMGTVSRTTKHAPYNLYFDGDIDPLNCYWGSW